MTLLLEDRLVKDQGRYDVYRIGTKGFYKKGGNEYASVRKITEVEGTKSLSEETRQSIGRRVFKRQGAAICPSTSVSTIDKKGNGRSIGSFNCFAGVWLYLKSDVVKLLITNDVPSKAPFEPLSAPNLAYYVRMCKKSGVVPDTKAWTAKSMSSTQEVVLSDFVNGAHYYNAICAFRNIVTKPEQIRNCIKLHRTYPKLGWATCMALSNYMSTCEEYYQVFNMGCSIPDLFKPIFDTLVPVQIIEGYVRLCEKPESFRQEDVNASNTGRFYTSNYINNTSNVTIIKKTVQQYIQEALSNE